MAAAGDARAVASGERATRGVAPPRHVASRGERARGVLLRAHCLPRLATAAGVRYVFHFDRRPHAKAGGLSIYL